MHLHRRLALGEQALEAIGLAQRPAPDRGEDPLVAPLLQAREQGSQRSFFAVVAGDRLAQILGLTEGERDRRLGFRSGRQRQRLF